MMPMRWGLVPSWWKKKAKEAPATFNARAETVAEKPMFRDAFRRSRCSFPFGLLRVAKNADRQAAPYYTASDGSRLTIAGLWDEWKDIETRQPVMHDANHQRQRACQQDTRPNAGWNRIAEACTRELFANLAGVETGE